MLHRFGGELTLRLFVGRRGRRADGDFRWEKARAVRPLAKGIEFRFFGEASSAFRVFFGDLEIFQSVFILGAKVGFVRQSEFFRCKRVGADFPGGLESGDRIGHQLNRAVVKEGAAGEAHRWKKKKESSARRLGSLFNFRAIFSDHYFEVITKFARRFFA